MGGKPKTINGLMKHLRSTGIQIKGCKQKNQLINQGYYHGYKGYRFYKKSTNRLPFSDYEQINQTILYDSRLKNLLYGHVMFIEMALKNISLEAIVSEIDSNDLNDMYKNVITNFRNCPNNFNQKQKEKAQKDFFALQSIIHSNISREYEKKNDKITHFYNNPLYKNIPLWTIFEILSMGDFGKLLSTLTYDMRDKIEKRIGFRLSVDTNRELLHKYVYTLKDLRNAIAHNYVVYDARFSKMNPTKAMKQCLIQELGLQYIAFEDLIDYIALIVYIEKLLGVSKKELRTFVRQFEELTDAYMIAVGGAISKITINNNWRYRLKIIQSYI